MRHLLARAALVGATAGAFACTTTSHEVDIKVVRTGKAKSGAFAVIDAGKNRGLKMGDRVCFKDKSGAEVACGKVATLRESAAGVSLDDADAKKVRVGALAEALALAPTAPGEPIEVETESEKAPAPPPAAAAAPESEEEEGEPIEPADPKPEATTALATRLRAHFVYGLANPVAYEAVGFNQKARTDAKAAPWSSTATVETPAYGVKVSFHKPLSAKLELAPALFYSTNNDFAAEARFDPLQPKSLVRSMTTGTEKGVALDVGYLLASGGSYRVVGLGGLSILNSKLVMDATLDDPTSQKTFTVAKYESYLYALGLDLGVTAEYHFGSFLVALDFGALVPLSVLKAGNSGFVDFTDADFGAADFHLEAVEKAVDHRKTSAGYGLGFGVGYQF